MDMPGTPQSVLTGVEPTTAGTETTPKSVKEETPQAPPGTSHAGVHLGSVLSDREILMRGRRAFDRGEDAAALENLTRLTRHGNQFADVLYMIGILHERAGDLDAALESLRSAIRINPSYVEALLALASLHERRGNFDQSQGYAERASQLSRPTAGGLDPTTRGKLANQQAALGDALAQAGEQRDAIEQYRGALDRCPTFHDIRHRLGIALREAGLPFQAAQEFQRILRIHKGMLDSRIQLGLTFYSMGRTTDAISEWQTVLEAEPGNEEAGMYLRLVQGAARRARLAQDAGGSDTESPPTTAMASPARNVLDGDDLTITGWSTSELAGNTLEETPEHGDSNE